MPDIETIHYWWDHCRRPEAEVCNALQDVYMDDSMSSGGDDAKGLLQLLTENSGAKQSQI